MENSSNSQSTNVSISPPDGILFIDHSRTGRSGHLGHALVEYEPGKVLAFYPNCSDKTGLLTHGEEWSGHNGDGWMEYKRSEDGGRTWSDPITHEYSKRAYEEGNGRSVMSEKAVCAQDGSIVLFNLESDMTINRDWGPTWVPTYMRSTDGGETWSAPQPVSMARGRIFAAIVREESIFVIQREQVYSLLVSTDNGLTFTRRSVLPFDAKKRGYAAMTFLHDGSMAVYVYNPQAEQHLDCAVSRDQGSTWEAPVQVYMEKKIRNPQVAAFKGGFVMHGRSGSGGLEKGHLVLYTSEDGLNWDGGIIMQEQTAGAGAYSNNLLVHDPADPSVERLLIQASHAYEKSKTNIYHWWIT